MNKTDEERLVLGTAQLGMRYGIANKLGQPDLRAAEAIVEAAWEGNVREFDTAQSYGVSEKVLGSVLRRLGIGEQARIISKLNPELDHLTPSTLRAALERSLENLGISELYGIMLHREELLELWDKGLGEIFSNCVAAGLAENIGVSIYSPQKALDALEIQGVNIIQIPSNILDRRFERAGIFQAAERKSKQIYTRSVFLQGLLLMDPDDLPSSMGFACQTLRTFASLCEKANVSKPHLALGYVREVYHKAKILFGAETPDQVKTDIKNWGFPLSQGIIQEAQEVFQEVEQKILDPSLWPN
jgi:aryl-alcohol dehydrogenase-like predicted oxidoreductase